MLLSVNQTIKQTTLGRTKLYELINSGEVQSVKIGSRRLIVAASLTRLIESLTSH